MFRPAPLVALVVAALAPLAFAAPREARTLYNAKCALCHGRDGRTNAALAHAKVRDFTDAAWQKEISDEQLRAAIAEGRPETLMRAFKDELSAAEIAALVAYIRAFAPPADKK